LPAYVPFWAYLALGVAAVLTAVRAPARESLARFGIATIVVSPSLWGHGMLAAVPSMLSLRAPWLWLAIGITAAPNGAPWWLAIGLVAASWTVPALQRRTRDPAAAAREKLHLLGANLEPWPDQAFGGPVVYGRTSSYTPE
jgi:hypothetical protein